MSAHGHLVPPLRPADGGHRVVLIGQITESSYLGESLIISSCQLGAHLAGEGGPEVDAGAQPHTQHVLTAPVHEVEIEVVLELGRVQHLERDLGDLPGGLPGTSEQLDALGGDGGEGVGRGGLVDDVGPPRPE